MFPAFDLNMQQFAQTSVFDFHDEQSDIIDYKQKVIESQLSGRIITPPPKESSTQEDFKIDVTSKHGEAFQDIRHSSSSSFVSDTISDISDRLDILGEIMEPGSEYVPSEDDEISGSETSIEVLNKSRKYSHINERNNNNTIKKPSTKELDNQSKTFPLGSQYVPFEEGESSSSEVYLMKNKSKECSTKTEKKIDNRFKILSDVKIPATNTLTTLEPLSNTTPVSLTCLTLCSIQPLQKP